MKHFYQCYLFTYNASTNHMHEFPLEQVIELVSTRFFKITLLLKELRNRILRVIVVWSLICLLPVYVGLHFLPILLEN